MPSPTTTTCTSSRRASTASRSTCFSGASRPTKPTIGLPSGDHCRAQFVVPGRRGEAGDVHPARPVVDARNAMCLKIFDRRRGRRQRTVGTGMQMPRPRPGRLRRHAHAVTGREPGDIGLEHRHRRHTEIARGVQPAVAEQRRRGQVHHVRDRIRAARRRFAAAAPPTAARSPSGTSASGTRCTRIPSWMRSAADLAARVVRGDDEGFVAGAAKVLEHPQHRVGHSVDVGQK